MISLIRYFLFQQNSMIDIGFRNHIAIQVRFGHHSYASEKLISEYGHCACEIFIDLE